NFKVDRAGGWQVDDQFKLGRPHYREFGRLGAFEDFAGVDTGLTVPFRLAGSVAHQAAGFRKVAQGVDRRNRMSRRQRGNLQAPADKNVSEPTKSASALLRTSAPKAASISRLSLACMTSIRIPIADAAVVTSLVWASVAGKFGLTSRPTCAAAGMSSCTSPACFEPISEVKKLTPVALPPGWFRLTTKPSFTGSEPVVKTIGTVPVAAFATRMAGVLVAAMTETWRRTRSAACVGNRSYRPSAQRYSIVTFWPST